VCRTRLPAGGSHGKRLGVEANLPVKGRAAMTATAKVKPSVVPAEALLGQDRDLFKQLLKESLRKCSKRR